MGWQIEQFGEWFVIINRPFCRIVAVSRKRSNLEPKLEVMRYGRI